jgi:GntR family transcriptional regulator
LTEVDEDAVASTQLDERRLGDRRPASQLRRSSEGTLHRQLYETLVDMIRNGQARPGDRMPTEAQLGEQYDVSRTTARRALDELRRQGLVERKPGKGTFVLPPRLHAPIAHLHSLTDVIEHLGYTPGTLTLSVARRAADEGVAKDLGIEVGDTVVVVDRVRTADGDPVYVGSSTLNTVAFPALAEVDFSTGGMYAIFVTVTGLGLERAVQWLSAVAADPQTAKSLAVEPGSPVLKLERVVYLEGGIPVESVVGHFHGDLYKAYSESRPLGGGQV